MKKIFNFQFSIFNNKGFTLIEVLISVTIFSLIIAAIGGLFIQTLRVQRQAFLGQQIHENINFVLEEMAREIRVSKVCPQTGQCASSTLLDITHPVNGKIQYYLSNNQIHRVVLESVGGNCSSPPCDTTITSSAAMIKRLNFFVNGDANNDGKQPRVTIVITASATQGGLSTEISAETTVSQRFLSDNYKK